MNKPGKIISTIAILGIVVLVSLTILVNVFLSEDKLKGIIIPQAEKALGRDVQISGISVSLFSGITVRDMMIKEADKKKNFAGIKEFVLKYELLPLLSKKIVISRIILREPQITIHRDRTGKFNFSTLALPAAAVTQKKTASSAPPPPTTTGAELPMALTVDRITIDKARLAVSDDIGELPEIKGEVNAGIGVDMSGGLDSLRLSGDLDFIIDAVYQQLKPHVQGTAHFNQQQIDYNVDVELDNEKARLAGSAADFLASPDIKLDITSKKLDLDHLMGLMAGLAQPATASTKSKEKSAASQTRAPAKPLAAALPPGLKVQGKIAVDQSLYKGLAVDNLLLRYSLVDGILNLADMGADIAQGKVKSQVRIDLNKPDPAYDGEFKIDKVKVEQLVAGISETDFNQLTGALQTAVNFKGKGLAWPQISKSLQAKGDYGLLDGQIQETPVTRAVADLLKLDDLRKLSFEKIAGNLEVKNGRLFLKSIMDGKDISAESLGGSIGLDGSMNMPLSIKLSPELSKKLQKNLSIAKYLSSENGETELNFKIGGTVRNPKPALDDVAVENVVIDIGGRELNKLLSGHKDKTTNKETKEGETKNNELEDAGRRLLKGFLGK